MRLVRTIMVAALPLLAVGAAPPGADERVLDFADPYVTLTVNRQPMRLRVDFDAPVGTVFLNLAAAERAGLRASSTRTVKEPSKLTILSALGEVDMGSKTKRLNVEWSSNDVVGDGDGAIGVQSLLENRVTLRIHAAYPGERTIELPVGSGLLLSYRMMVGKQSVSVLTASQAPYSTATAAAGAHLAAAQDGHWSGPPVILEFDWAGARPGRAIDLRQPLDLNGLPLHSFLVRTSDFRGSYRLPSDPPQPDADEIVVTATPAKGTAMLQLTLGRDALAGCSSISHDKKRRVLKLQCL